MERGDRTVFDDERITVNESAINLTDWIIQAPSRTEIMDENGAIRMAAQNGHVEVVRFLLQDDRVNPCAIDNYAIRKWFGFFFKISVPIHLLESTTLCRSCEASSSG